MVTLQHVQEAKSKLEGVAYKTPLMKSLNLSDRFASNILLKIDLVDLCSIEDKIFLASILQERVLWKD